MKSLFRKITRRVRNSLLGTSQNSQTRALSTEYSLADYDIASTNAPNGWAKLQVAQWQDAEYRKLLAAMYAGAPREDFVVAAESVKRVGLKNPSVLEVGCGSGYYSEVLANLCGHPIRYIGLDYSFAMVSLAIEHYGTTPILVGNATALPFPSHSFDIVFNGVSLMHILDYQGAIAESRRVSQRACIFHTVPVLQKRSTTVLSKRAYGEKTLEVIFNETELREFFRRNGLGITSVLVSIPYNLEAVLGEPTETKTFVCETCG